MKRDWCVFFFVFFSDFLLSNSDPSIWMQSQGVYIWWPWIQQSTVLHWNYFEGLLWIKPCGKTLPLILANLFHSRQTAAQSAPVLRPLWPLAGVELMSNIRLAGLQSSYMSMRTHEISYISGINSSGPLLHHTGFTVLYQNEFTMLITIIISHG